MPSLRRLITEIHRRSLWQVLGIYLVGAWIAYEVILGLSEGGVLPTWFPGLTVGLFVLGLPFVLATAFVREGLPGAAGRRDLPADEPSHTGPGPHRWLTWRNALLICFALFVVGGVFAASSMVLAPAPGDAMAADRGALTIAVLPFENLSADQEDEYFTEGVHDEILTQLFKISSLSVTSRTSVLAYRDRPSNVRTVAEELGVRYILEGTVRRFGNQVKITGQLIDAARDVHIWSDSYTRDRGDLLAMQADVAKQIAHELSAELTPEEVARIDALPTTSTEAYDAYLRGLNYNRSGYVAGREKREADWRIAGEMYERAIAHDPDFAVAHADLAFTHLRFYWYGYDRTRERAERGRREIEAAFRIAPDLPQAYVYRGYYKYWIDRDYDGALEQFRRGLVGLPGDFQVRSLIGFVHRRKGNLEEAAAEIERAVRQDPLNGNLAEELGNTLRGLRRWEDAARYLNRAIELAPDYPDAYLGKIDMLVSWTGSTEGARRVLDEAVDMAPDRDLLITAIWLETLDRRYDQALRRIDGFEEPVIDRQYDLFPAAQLRASVLELAGRRDEARTHYREALRVLDEVEMDSVDYRRLRARARALSGLGRHEEALAAAQHALELIPMELDAWTAPDLIEDLAFVLMRAGREAEAVGRLQFLLEHPSRNRVTVPLLRLDPRWEPLRGRDDFRRLLARAL